MSTPPVSVPSVGTPLTVGVVGCRGMGAGHAQHLGSLTDLYRVVGLCDLDANLANEVAGKHPGAKAYTDYTKMLAEAKPDVVVVATVSAISRSRLSR